MGLLTLNSFKMKNKSLTESSMKAILGTMNFGPQVNLRTAEKMIRLFLARGYREIDTAYVYNDGATENILGKILPKLDRASFSIASKANPRVTGKLDYTSVITQCNESIIRMNLEYIDILYLHMPDSQTPIEEGLRACNKLFDEGKIKTLALSNFPSWLVAKSVEICKKNDWVTPSIYQGLYNGLSRNVERELFTCLKEYDIMFYAYNPLAGGLLTGKHLNFENEPPFGRFSRLESYRKRYWKKTYFAAVDQINEICLMHGIPTAEAAYRWIINHSMLKTENNDAIIIGASTMKQFEDNLSIMNSEELPVEILTAFDDAYEISNNDSPEYFYFY